MGASCSKTASKRRSRLTGDSSTSVNSDSDDCPGRNSFLKHSPSLPFDLIIVTISIIASTFLIYSHFFYVSNALFALFPSFSLGFVVSLVIAFVSLLICSGICFRRSYRKCGRVGCNGLNISKEYDVLVQGKEYFSSSEHNNAVRAVNELPWQSDFESRPNYNRLHAKLKKMAPPSGRAVLIFRSKCGCPTGKIESWGPRHGPRRS